MKSSKNATLVFGLVNVPVGLASVATERKIEFRQLHRECSTPIKQRQFCEADDRVVEATELVRAYEYGKDMYLPIEEDELAGVLPERDPVIRVSKFVEAVELDPLQVQRSYYLLPNKVFAHNYEVLERAIAGTGLIAIGTHSLWGKEAPVAIESYDGLLLLRLLWCADELKDSSDAGEFLGTQIADRELALAKDILMAMRGTLEPEDLRSEPREKLTEFVTAKLAGFTVEQAETNEEKLKATVDLMASLKETLAVSRKAQPKAKKAATRKPRQLAKK